MYTSNWVATHQEAPDLNVTLPKVMMMVDKLKESKMNTQVNILIKKSIAFNQIKEL